MKEKINYAPKYHPQDDPLPIEEIEEIPFPKSHRNDDTSWKFLVIAKSRIGNGESVYTLTHIPANTVIMEYVNESADAEKNDKKRTKVDNAYVYYNDITTTEIDATNNTYSYCGLVNEAC